MVQPMSPTLYYAPMSSASPVLWALAELELEYEGKRLDLTGVAHKQPEYLALNPMGQVPALVDNGQAMFESSACMIYLGEKYGVAKGVWPEVGSPAHMVALTWLNWAAVSVGGTLRQLFASGGDHAPPEMHCKPINDYAREQFGNLMLVLEGHLRDREYIAGAFSLTDAYVAASLGWSTGVVGFDLASAPNLKAWLGRCMTRPAAAVMNP